MKKWNHFLQIHKIAFLFLVAWAAILMIPPNEPFAQTVPQVLISGRVTDASNGEPLYFVNVFLSNTTRGAATDKNGYFYIENVPLGNYELVVSMMGYEMETIQIKLNTPVDREFNFKLRSKPLQIPEIKVSAPYPHEWKKNLKRFERYFLGTSRNASKCKILNPEILDLQFDESTNLLTVRASKSLQIENRALGYRIVTYLKEFAFRDDFDGRYVCQSRYELLPPEDEKEEENWEKNRLKSYLGSKRHFFTALASGRLKEEGYIIKNVLDFSRAEESAHFKEVKGEDILFPAEKPLEKKLAFPNYLKVLYTKEREEKEYIWYDRSGADGQTSWLKMNLNAVNVNTSGHLENPYAITVDGYMAWERFAEALPLDYILDAESKYRYISPMLDEGPPADVDLVENLPHSEESEETTPSDPVVLLKQARKAALKDDVQEATKALYIGLEDLGNNPYADTLTKEIFDIMTDNDRKAYKKAPDKGQYLLRFWQKQDPTLATWQNERFVEHMKRLEYVREWYHSVDPRGYDDRGIVYLRYGPPDERIDMSSPRALYANECWVYRLYGREIVFDFIQRAASYKLSSDLTKISPLQTKQLIYEQLFEFVEPRMDVSRAYFALGTELLHKLDAQERDALPRDEAPPTSENVMAETVRLQELTIEKIDEQGRLPPVVTSLSKIRKPLSCALYMARFPRQDNTQLEIYYGVPCHQLGYEQLSDIENRSELQISHAVRDTSYSLTLQKNRRRIIQVPPGSSLQNRVYIDQINETLSPGKYIVSVEIKNPKANKTFEKTYTVEIPKRSSQDLTLSDLELAYNVETTAGAARNPVFVKGDLSVTPYPYLTVSKKKPVYLYFEVKNLLLDASGRSSYKVEYIVRTQKSTLEKISPFSKKGMALSSSYRRKGKGRNEQEYFSLDFEKVKPGKYTLIVLVTDETARSTQSTEVDIQVEK